jgi:hypothetical protein
MKVNELFEAEFINTIIDRELQRQHNAKKPKMADSDKATRAFTNGFRYGFASGSLMDTDPGKENQKHYDAGIKLGKAEAKNHKDIPDAKKKGNLGQRNPNPAFEKLVKSAMVPHLEKFKAG